MVDDNIDDLVAKLKKLSPREWEVINLRCQGLKYKQIGKKLNIAESTVKEDMSRIYLKLGLDVLDSAVRVKILYDTFCPLLKLVNRELEKIGTPPIEIIDGEFVPIQEEPIPDRVKDMVEKDENAIAVVSSRSIIPYEKPKKKSRWFLWLIGGVVLGICLSSGGIFLLLRLNNWSVPFIPQPTTVLTTGTLAPSPTLEIPTQIPVIVEKIVVVTATPPPATQVPTFTALPQPVILFEDNFDQGLSNGWNVASGNPLFINGELTSDQNTWLIIGDKSWTDYKIQFSVQTAKCWYYDNWNAIGVRAQDTGNMIAFKWASCESELDIVKNGNWLTVPNSHVSKGNYGTVPITITITVQGGQFTFDINGERISSLFNSDYLQGGVALRVGEKTQIDNFKITAIQ